MEVSASLKRLNPFASMRLIPRNANLWQFIGIALNRKLHKSLTLHKPSFP